MTHTGCLLATIDDEMGKIGPGPKGCGANPAILHSRPRRWTRHSLRTRLHLHPTDEDLSAGAPGLAEFSLATPSAPVVLTGPSFGARSRHYLRFLYAIEGAGYTLAHGVRFMLPFLARLSVMFLLGSGMLFAQQPAGEAPQQPARTTSAKQHSSTKAKPAPAAMSVEVLNGTEKRTQVFRSEQSSGTDDQKPVAGSAGKRGSTRNAKGEPAVTRVEIFNGNTSYTKTFQGSDERSEAGGQRPNGKPVVVGISNGGTTTRNGKLQPVVTGVASSESNNGAGSKQPVVVGVASSGSDTGKPVVQSVQAGTATHPPKRRPYRGPTSNP